ncbi:MAG: hypothetical protein LBK00_05370 [Treponema sp.]|jgi:hypothetical protein|nr:hypothetical protein [Treponema sp.]
MEHVIIQKTAKATGLVQEDPLGISRIYTRFEGSLYVHRFILSRLCLSVNGLSKLSLALCRLISPRLNVVFYDGFDKVARMAA